MTALSSLEILRFFDRHGSAGLNLEMLRSGLFEEQLKLASQSSNVSGDEEVRGGLPMIKKTLPIGPATPAPPPEVLDAPGRDEKLQTHPAQTKQKPGPAPSAVPAPSEETTSPRGAETEHSSRPEEQSPPQSSCPSSSPIGTAPNPQTDTGSPSTAQQVVPVSAEPISAEESIGGQHSEGTDPAPTPLSEILPEDTEQLISPKKEEKAPASIAVPAGSGQGAVAGVSETFPANPVSQEKEQPAGLAGAERLDATGAKNIAGLQTAPGSEAESGNAILSGVFTVESAGGGGHTSGSDPGVGNGHSGVGGEPPGNNSLFILPGTEVGQAGGAAVNLPASVVPGAPGLLLPTGAISEPAGSGGGHSAASATEPIQAAQAEGSGRATVAGTQTGAASSGASQGRGVSSADSSSGSRGPEGSSQEANVQRVRFIQRVARAFQTLRDGGGSIRLRLHPPELGSLRVELLVRDGALRARMEVENQAARTTLLEHLPMLRERLAQQDIRIEQFEVEIGQEFSGSHSQQPGSSTPEQQGLAFGPANHRPRNTNAGVLPTRGNPAATSESSKLNVVI